MSLLELIAYSRRGPWYFHPLQWNDWRPGDQPVFVCGLDKAQRLPEWQPSIPVREGVRQLISWVRATGSCSTGCARSLVGA